MKRVLKILCLVLALFFTLNNVFAYEYSEVRAEHILVKTKAEAVNLENKIENGENFEALAKKYSMCPSGQRGGDLGYFSRGQMVQPFENTAFDMAIGEVSEPVQTQYGWHIIKVLDKR